MNLIFLLHWMYSFEQLVILGEVVKLNYCIVLQEGKILVMGCILLLINIFISLKKVEFKLT